MSFTVKSLLLMAFTARLMSCSIDPEEQRLAKQAADAPQNGIELNEVEDTSTIVATPVNNGEARYVDSMMSIEVTLPPILDEKAYDTATVNGFTRLATLTKGEMRLLASADLLEENITDIICKNNVDHTDILFLVDNSGSMYDDIEAVKQGMNQIITVLKEKKGVKLAIATYRDKQYNTDWFSFQEFGTDYEAAKAFVNGMKLESNNDLPESVYEGFIEAADHKFWTSRTKRIVLIIGDARPKEKEEGGMYTMQDMLNKAAESKIKVNFYPLIVTPYSEKYRRHDLNPKPATQTKIIDRVYPNPTNGPIYIKMAQTGRYRVAVYTMTGLLVEDQYIDSDIWMVDMRVHTDGLYVIRITDDNNQYDVGKFLLQK